MFTVALFTVGKIWKQPKCPQVSLVGEMSEGGRKVQSSSYKLSQPWDGEYNVVAIVNTVMCI